MSANGDHPSDSPPEYPMGIAPSEDITEPDLRSSRQLIRSLSEEMMAQGKMVREIVERLARLEAQVSLIPKRHEQ